MQDTMSAPQPVLLFAGQGSQYYNMGRALFDTNPTFRNTMLGLDEVAVRLTGLSVIEYLYDGNKRYPLDRLLYSHPAIFMVQYALARTVSELLPAAPAYVLGSSLGETVAAAVSGAIPAEDMLEIVIRQAALVERSCAEGGMITLLHDQTIFENEPALYMNAVIAAYNYDAHFTLSAAKTALSGISSFLHTREIMYSVLPVKYAFHSSEMEKIGALFLDGNRDKHFSLPVIPFYSSVYAREWYDISITYFWQVIRRRIRFKEAIESLEKSGPYYYIDCSPSGTLKNLTAKIAPASISGRLFDVLSPFGKDGEKLKTLQTAIHHISKQISLTLKT
ncbi:Acyl transferase [Chitinophaga pinensis DSM 2588]|uniref:Acyl transferase n=2 Tax=Chitinophaga pinensis TaxID=79329 RepID=A0A979GZQ3_CHIPD|nr:Acyl transferase [Chitinophaga pinensis DSM 2588]